MNLNIRYFYHVLQQVFCKVCKDSRDEKNASCVTMKFMDGWTFLTNHSHVLLSIAADPESRLRDVAQRVGITERAAQRIVADLIDGGYLTSTKIGRRNRYTLNPDRRLRHPIEQHCRITSLLSMANNNAVTEPVAARSKDDRHSPNGQQKHGARRAGELAVPRLKRGRRV
jgi:hypothetical protein